MHYATIAGGRLCVIRGMHCTVQTHTQTLIHRQTEHAHTVMRTELQRHKTDIGPHHALHTHIEHTRTKQIQNIYNVHMHGNGIAFHGHHGWQRASNYRLKYQQQRNATHTHLHTRSMNCVWKSGSSRCTERAHCQLHHTQTYITHRRRVRTTTTTKSITKPAGSRQQTSNNQTTTTAHQKCIYFLFLRHNVVFVCVVRVPKASRSLAHSSFSRYYNRSLSFCAPPHLPAHHSINLPYKIHILYLLTLSPCCSPCWLMAPCDFRFLLVPPLWRTFCSCFSSFYFFSYNFLHCDPITLQLRILSVSFGLMRFCLHWQFCFFFVFVLFRLLSPYVSVLPPLGSALLPQICVCVCL